MRRHEALAGQLVQQAVGEIVEIVQPVAQIGIGLAHHLGPRVALDALDRRLRGQARHHGLAQPPQPAAVMGEHPERLEHLPMLARAGLVAPIDQPVDRLAQRLDCIIETRRFRIDVLGDDLVDDHARLVQHHVAEPDAFVDARCP